MGRSSVLDLADDETGARASRKTRGSPGSSLVVREKRGSIYRFAGRIEAEGPIIYYSYSDVSSKRLRREGS